MCIIDLMKSCCDKNKLIEKDVNDYVIEKKLMGYECIICFEGFGEGQDVSLIKCGHMYHTKCIYTWFVTKKTCPLCDDKLKI